MNYTTKKLNNIKIAVALLLDSSLYIKEIAEVMSSSRSSVQRFLNDPIIKELYNEETQRKIKERLNNNYHNGKQKGGIIFSKNNQYIKKRNGKFCGSVKKS